MPKDSQVALQESKIKANPLSPKRQKTFFLGALTWTLWGSSSKKTKVSPKGGSFKQEDSKYYGAISERISSNLALSL